MSHGAWDQWTLATNAGEPQELRAPFLSQESLKTRDLLAWLHAQGVEGGLLLIDPSQRHLVRAARNLKAYHVACAPVSLAMRLRFGAAWRLLPA